MAGRGTWRLISALSPDSVCQRGTLVPALPWLAKLKAMTECNVSNV